MTRKTLKALQASIEHWKRMRTDIDCGEQPYDNDCPLCKLFIVDESHHCTDCPVYKKTGVNECQSTPWRDAEQAWMNFSIDDKATVAQWRRAAMKMIKFLESLLPVKP
jgi:hypothetical protein